MIASFRHKGLEKFYRTGSSSGIAAKHVKRLRLILGVLDAAEMPKDLDLPGLRMHRLSGQSRHRWAVWVSGNWRVTFEFDGPNAHRVDYEDYH